MPTAPAVVRSRFKWHTRATWSAREDRIPSLVWLALIWFGIGLWTAMVAKAPVDSGPASPQFLSVNFGSLIAFVFFVSWGVALRGNPAAHKRIMILTTVAILDPGYGRLSGWLWPEPQSMLTWYFFNFWGDVLVLAAMAVWDAWRGRLMKQFAAGATGLIFLQCLQDLLYHWGPWKVFTTRLIAAWSRHIR